MVIQTFECEQCLRLVSCVLVIGQLINCVNQLMVTKSSGIQKCLVIIDLMRNKLKVEGNLISQMNSEL